MDTPNSTPKSPEPPQACSMQRIATRLRVKSILARTNHVAAAREREYAREASQK